jgi:hypothetical protein
MKLTVITLLSTTILTGCGKEAPKCSDAETTDLLKQVYHDVAFNLFAERAFPSVVRGGLSKAQLEQKMEEVKISLYKEVPALDRDKTDYIVESVITTSTNKETGSHTCKCTIKTVSKQTSETFGETEIAYQVELSDDGKQFFVSLIQ